MFVGSTPFPPALAAGVLEAIKILRTDKTLRRRLNANTAYIRKQLGDTKSSTQRPGPIHAIAPRDQHEANVLSKRLLTAGIYPPLASYGRDAGRGHFRFAISSEHTREQLDLLIATLLTHAKKF